MNAYSTNNYTRGSNKERGFTIIELLVVTATVSVLSAIALPQYMSYTSRANDRAAQVALKSVATAQEAYFVDNFTYVSCTESTCPTLLTGIRSIQPGIKVTVNANGDSFSATAHHTAGTGEVFQWEG